MQASDDHPLSHFRPLEVQSPPRMALLQVSEQSYKDPVEFAPSARFALRYVMPLVPKTLAQRRILRKAFARKRKLAEVPALQPAHQPFTAPKPPQPQPRVKTEAAPVCNDDTLVYRPPRFVADIEIKSSPDAKKDFVHEVVYARDWDSKFNAPVLNFPIRKFRVVRREPGGVMRTLSDIDLPVTFVQPPAGSDQPCVSTCNEYVLLQLSRRSLQKNC
jgi:hypothetical protein